MIYDSYKKIKRPITIHMLNFTSDEPAWKLMSKMLSHGGINCCDKCSFTAEPVISQGTSTPSVTIILWTLCVISPSSLHENHSLILF